MKERKMVGNAFSYIFLTLFLFIVILPLLFILMNSFKGKLYINSDPFSIPKGATFAGWDNYITGLTKMNFPAAFATSLFVTVCSTLLIVLFTAMTAWYLARVKTGWSTALYYLFVFSMIVPFQMVMFTMSWLANRMGMGTPWGLLVMYLGFGAGMSVFMYSGFVKGVPVDIEEAATIDGCDPLQCFFRVVFPVMRPIAITVAILNAMWIWNDYLLPVLVLNSQYRTLPVAVQGIMTGSYGARDMGGLMAMLVLSIIPIVVFYLFGQKYIIEGVLAGAVKG